MKIEVSSEKHLHYAEEIKQEMADSAKVRGTGIAQRTVEFLCQKMLEGSAVLAIEDDGRWMGFCYLSSWSDGAFVANSGMIVSPNFRKRGVAKMMKAKIFELSREKYPEAKIFSLTTGLAVMKINYDLGYQPVTYSEITKDDTFWEGCKSCVNYDVLKSKNRENCLCTAMLYTPNKERALFNSNNSKITKDEEKCGLGV
ncbi:GNAT family N-acetyltransferase [Soonwooa sp.]|uniref:GNAT family N-acetyltransferase n=1 Tax=Soonwooa sp. TaxID=1938592 RepID=UPI002609F762|nr:GNAT family N-acetyltransferase [Soonwooa sp.]